MGVGGGEGSAVSSCWLSGRCEFPGSKSQGREMGADGVLILILFASFSGALHIPKYLSDASLQGCWLHLHVPQGEDCSDCLALCSPPFVDPHLGLGLWKPVWAGHICVADASIQIANTAHQAAQETGAFHPGAKSVL